MLTKSSQNGRELLNDLSDYFHGAPIGLHLTDAGGMIRRTNLAELRLLEYPAEEYVGHHVGEFFAEPEAIRSVLDRLAAGESVREEEATLVKRDGSPQKVLLYANARFEDGAFAGIRCATFPHPNDQRPDIAELAALTDQSVEARGIELGDEEEQALLDDLSDFFEESPVNGHIVGGDGLINHASRSELDSMGYESDSYIGEHIARFHADQAVIDGMLGDLVGGTPLVNFNATLFHKDGSKLPVMIYSNSRMRDGDFINTRCFTVPVPRQQPSAEEKIAFSWPRNEDFGFTIAGRDLPTAPSNPMTVALKYIASRKRPEESLGFLARLSETLGEPRALSESLADAARLCVPFLADAVSIESDGRQLAQACAGSLRPAVDTILARLADSRSGSELSLEAVRQSRRTAAAPPPGDDSTDEGWRQLRALGVQSAIVAPMVVHDRVLGTIVFLREEGAGRRPFGAADRSLAEEVARRVAFNVALDRVAAFG
jgi:hypothetical protein